MSGEVTFEAVVKLSFDDDPTMISMPMSNDCEKFGFKNGMTDRERTVVYRKQSRKYHPDKNDGKRTPLWDELKDCYDLGPVKNHLIKI